MSKMIQTVLILPMLAKLRELICCVIHSIFMPTEPLTPRITQPSDQNREKRERRIDEALEETFPGSDPPAFISGAIPGSHEGSATKRSETAPRAPTDWSES